MNMNLFDLFGAIISLFRDQMDTIIISYVVKNTESMKSYTNSVEVDVDSLPSEFQTIKEGWNEITTSKHIEK